MRGIIFGAFDFLHAGHILALKEAKKHCDYLIVGLHVDPSIERKDKTKPVQGILERQIQLSGCKYVDDYIIYETEEDIEVILTNLNIGIRFLGGDYKTREDVTGKDLVHIHYLTRSHPYSTTRIRNRL
jgi:glycerol-3-phosphate cytidylyltransferase